MNQTAAGEQNSIPSPAMTPGEQVQSNPSPEPAGEQESNLSPEEVFAQQMEVAEEKISPERPVTTLEGDNQVPIVPEPSAEPTPIWHKAPQHWAKDRQEKFNALPVDQKEFIFSTVKGTEDNYQRKAQQLSEYRNTLSEFVASLPQQNQSAQQPQQQPAPQDLEPPADPIDRIKWEAKQEMREEIVTERKQEATRRTEAEISDISRKVDADPLMAETMKVLSKEIDRLPNVVNPHDPNGRTYQQIEYDSLDYDPIKFKSEYGRARAMVVNYHRQKQQQQPQPPGQPQAPVQPRRTVVPQLEQAGVQVPAAPPSDAQKVAKRRAEIVKGIRKGNVDSSTLSNYLNGLNVRL